MESSNRSSSSLGRRSIVARIAAVIALAGAGVAIYLVVMNFTGEGSETGANGDKKNQNAQQKKKDPADDPATYTVVAGDTLSGIAEKTGVPESKLQRLNPELDAETVNAGQVLNLRPADD